MTLRLGVERFSLRDAIRGRVLANRLRVVVLVRRPSLKSAQTNRLLAPY